MRRPAPFPQADGEDVAALYCPSLLYASPEVAAYYAYHLESGYRGRPMLAPSVLFTTTGTGPTRTLRMSPTVAFRLSTQRGTRIRLGWCSGTESRSLNELPTSEPLDRAQHGGHLVAPALPPIT